MQEMKLTWEERIESIKAGGVAAIAIALFLPLTLLNRYLLPLSWQLDWVSSAIAIAAGFLFGITYRYIVRQDDNSHLRSGAVLAFGLVRGSAQIDIALKTQNSLLPFVAMAVESLAMFAIARLALEMAMRQTWIKPFRS
jgi:uncharacterized membrane protein